MPDNDRRGTIAEILKLSPPAQGQAPVFVNFWFEANVSIGEGRPTRKGGKIYDVTLSDPDDSSVKITTSFFQANAQYHGMLCRFAGNGTRRTEYNGRQEVSFGKNVVIEILGRTAAPGGQQQGGNKAPAHESSPPPTNTPPKALNASFEGEAIKLVYTSMQSDPEVLEKSDEEFAKILFQRASDLMRVYDRLAAGNRAKSPSERAGQTEQPPQDQGGRQDPPKRPPANESPVDDDVPF